MSVSTFKKDVIDAAATQKEVKLTTFERYTRKYGEFVKASKPDEPLTPGEQASFELLTTEQ